MEKNEGIFEALRALHESGMLPMHMPGHKRNAALSPYLGALGAGLDITEIEGFDNLHEPVGILREAQDRAATLWGAKESFFLVNGSSGGILAGLSALTNRGDEILIARNAHKSVFHAVELLGLAPRFLSPDFVGESSIFASVSPEKVESALIKYPSVRVVVVTSPSYDGVISDISSIARVCHARGALLFVDEAHGAHLGLGGGFPDGAVKSGADLVVQSLHKTLPSLTQTAILHVCSARVDTQRLRHALSVFQTSSPSYLFMASIDACVTLLRNQRALLASWRDALRGFDAETAVLSKIELPLRGKTPETVYAFDPSKIVLSSRRASGETLATRLREAHGIELEMAVPDHALAMTGLGDTRETLARFASALASLDRALAALPEIPASHADTSLYRIEPELVMPTADALRAKHRHTPLSACAGQIAAEYVWAYPPGVCMVLPGERITPALAEALASAARIPGHLHGSSGALPDGICTVEQ